MSQRNPMNDRYMTERQGQTRKSAASAKPKSQRAATLRDPTPKTRKQKKKEQREREVKARQRITAIDARYEDTEEYRHYRRIWWGFLITAICCTVISFALSTFADSISFIHRETVNTIGLITMIAAYGFIILAFFVDFSPVRKGRKAFQARALYDNSKEARAAQKQARAKERESKEAAQAQAEAEPETNATTPEKPKGLFGFMKRSKKDADASNDNAEDTSSSTEEKESEPTDSDK